MLNQNSYFHQKYVLLVKFFKYYNQVFMEVEKRVSHHQLIDDKKQFHSDAIQKVCDKLPQKTKQYYNIGIIGVQNSGKSTLLNYLFGTKFEVLQGNYGDKTTRGIWVSLDKEKDFIVMDVEGNDSSDNAQCQEFQKMVSTFALSSANLLMINVAMKNVGAFKGTQYETLVTVLGICLETFKQQNPKTLLFCLRDYIPESENIAFVNEKIKQDIKVIWNKIEKPSYIVQKGYQSSKFFNVQIFPIRKYKEKDPKNFIEDVNLLRDKYFNPNSESYVFEKQKPQFNIPISDLPELQQTSWKKIVNNEKLNLPSQKIQITQFRCSQISQKIKQEFKRQLTTIQRKAIDFGALLKKYMSQFTNQTAYYGKQITNKYRDQLQTLLKDQILKEVNTIIENKRITIKAQFQQQFSVKEGRGELTFQEQLSLYGDKKINQFQDFLKYLNYETSNIKETKQTFYDDIKIKIKQLVNRRYIRAKQNFTSHFERKILQIAGKMIKDNFGNNFWQKSNQQYQKIKVDQMQIFKEEYKWITNRKIMESSQVDKLYDTFDNSYKQVMKEKLQSSMKDRLYEYFREKMMKNDDKTTRNFQLLEQKAIEQIFDNTRNQIMKLLDNLNMFRGVNNKLSTIKDELIQEQQFFLNDKNWLVNFREDFDKSITNDFDKIIRQKKQAQLNKVPWWLFVIIIFFVYDDIWFTEKQNPFLHYTLTILMVFVLLMFAIGKGTILYDLVKMIGEKLPFA